MDFTDEFPLHNVLAGPEQGVMVLSSPYKTGKTTWCREVVEALVVQETEDFKHFDAADHRALVMDNVGFDNFRVEDIVAFFMADQPMNVRTRRYRNIRIPEGLWRGITTKYGIYNLLQYIKEGLLRGKQEGNHEEMRHMYVQLGQVASRMHFEEVRDKMYAEPALDHSKLVRAPPPDKSTGEESPKDDY